jgi:hypothetical protein
MENAATIVLRDMRPKILCLKVDEKVTIPWVIRGDEEEVFIGRISILTGEALACEGKFVMSSARMRTFFLLGVEKSRSYS